VVELKGVDEALVESAKLSSKLDFVGDIRCSLRVADADRLLYPENVGEIVPAVGILDGRERASLPTEYTVLSQKSTQRTAPGAAIEPIGRLATCRPPMTSHYGRQLIGGGHSPDDNLFGSVRLG